MMSLRLDQAEPTITKWGEIISGVELLSVCNLIFYEITSESLNSIATTRLGDSDVILTIFINHALRWAQCNVVYCLF